MTLHAGTRIVIGRAVAGAAVALAAYGVVTLVAIGRWDHFPLGAGMFALAALGFGALAWLAITRQPDNRAVWVPASAALLLGLGTAGWATAVLISDIAGLDVSAAGSFRLTPAESPLGAVIGWEVVNLGAIAGTFPMLTLWLLLFPNGELPSPRWKWVGWGAVASMVALVGVLGWLVRPGSTFPVFAEPEKYGGIVGFAGGALYVILIALAAACLVSLYLRYRQSTGDVRQQYRWVGFGTAALFFALSVVGSSVGQLLAALVGVTLSVICYGVAVTRYRLYDIDLVLNRTMVFILLAGFITAVYALMVVGLGRLVGGDDGLVLPVVATAVVAVMFEPMRLRAQRWANRVVYGQRATPYDVLSDLVSRLAVSEEGEGILVRMARLLHDGVGAESATVWLGAPDNLEPAATWPAESQLDDSVDLGAEDVFGVHHDGELVGAVQVIKPKGSTFSHQERSLITDVAGSAGLVLGYQRLNASLAQRAREVEESRVRLVGAQDEERRRLEKDLRQRVEQLIAELKLETLEALALARTRDAQDLAALLDDVATEAGTARAEVRSLARGIYPPVLVSDGLTAAVTGLAEGAPVEVIVSDGELGRYPSAVEAAVYFNVSEAITNAVKHANPPIRIDLSESQSLLRFTVTDKGPGFDIELVKRGSGLVNMQDRIDAVGGRLSISSTPGGVTEVVGEIPLEPVSA